MVLQQSRYSSHFEIQENKLTSSISSNADTADPFELANKGEDDTPYCKKSNCCSLDG